MSNTRKDTLNFRIDRPLLKRLRIAAKNEGDRTLGSIIREVVTQWVEQKENFEKQGKQ
jgi:predicted DNA-binding protein